MKNRIGVIVLAVLALALGIALAVVIQKNNTRQELDAQHISQFSNTLVQTKSLLQEQQQVATNLSKDLDEQKKAYADITNQLVTVSNQLSQTATNLARDLAQSAAALKASQEELGKRDAKIADLEAQNQALDKHAQELSVAITNLTGQIAETQRKLSSAEGDRAFLQKELKRLLSDKAELERQFSDVNVLRAQLSKVKQELVAARRAQWARDGMLYNPERKGGQLLMQGAGKTRPQPEAKPAYDLNVELHSDGPVKIIPPTNGPTFSPVPP